MTLAWVQAQIEETLREANSRDAVYDLAMLCLARNEMKARSASEDGYFEAAEKARQDETKKQTIRLMNYSADLNTVPTLQQIDDALGAIVVHDEESHKKAKDLRTWANIIGGK